MLPASYTLSSSLKKSLTEIDRLYQTILTTPVSPKTENLLRWDTTLAHLSGWASLSDQPLTPAQLQDIVTRVHTKRTSPLVAKIIDYKMALNYIRERWCANPATVTFDTVKELSVILGVQHGSQPEIESLLTHLQTGILHPVIQSAMTHLSFYPNRLCYLLSLLFLAKSGYDLRGWLSLEDYWNSHKDQYLKTLQPTANSSNALWLDYYCQAMASQMASLKSNLISLSISPGPTASKHLTDRQKTILNHLNTPESSITNRQVQALFKVSQITASRELARLSSSGLLIPHGSGRSTSYIRA